MAVTLKKLCSENDNAFKLSLLAGQNSIRNVVTWAYVLEDEYLIRYFHGSDLAVTTCMKLTMDPDWLMKFVKTLVHRRAAGLIINVGKFIFDIPDDVIDYCEQHDFPLMTMPWEIHITDLIHTFCTRIISEQQESVIHDKAIRDAIMKRENEEEYREILGRYYDLEGRFTIILVYTTTPANVETPKVEDMEYVFMNRIRRFKTKHGLKGLKIGLLSYENFELMLLNNTDAALLPEIRGIILDVYKEAASNNAIYIGVGIEVKGLANLSKSYHRARTAMRMAIYRNEPYVKFEDMGFYKILFSIKDDEILYSYADEILAPLDAYEADHEGFLELLKAYIHNDRSLERTAQELYLHRNTVNYRVQKLKTILDNPLKTVEDLFPYQVALAIRDMERHDIGRR